MIDQCPQCFQYSLGSSSSVIESNLITAAMFFPGLQSSAFCHLPNKPECQESDWGHCPGCTIDVEGNEVPRHFPQSGRRLCHQEVSTCSCPSMGEKRLENDLDAGLPLPSICTNQRKALGADAAPLGLRAWQGDLARFQSLLALLSRFCPS